MKHWDASFYAVWQPPNAPGTFDRLRKMSRTQFQNEQEQAAEQKTEEPSSVWLHKRANHVPSRAAKPGKDGKLSNQRWLGCTCWAGWRKVGSFHAAETVCEHLGSGSLFMRFASVFSEPPVASEEVRKRFCGMETFSVEKAQKLEEFLRGASPSILSTVGISSRRQVWASAPPGKIDERP